MDALTLLAAGLIGGGVTTLGVVVVATMRRTRTRVRRRESGPSKARRTRSTRPATARPLPPPAVRPQDARRTLGGPPVPPPGALGGETLQLGPVPAWRVAVTSPAAGGPARRGGGHLFGRRRGEYTSAAATIDAEAAVTDPRPGDAARNDRDQRGAPSVTANASRRHDPRTAAGRTPAR